jgi:hypothetical protein
MKKLIWILSLLISTFSFAQKTEDLTKYSKVITADALKAKLSVIASAEMEGRETASPGQKRQLPTLNQNLKEWG